MHLDWFRCPKSWNKTVGYLECYMYLVPSLLCMYLELAPWFLRDLIIWWLWSQRVSYLSYFFFQDLWSRKNQIRLIRYNHTSSSFFVFFIFFVLTGNCFCSQNADGYVLFSQIWYIAIYFSSAETKALFNSLSSPFPDRVRWCPNYINFGVPQDSLGWNS